MAKTTLTLPSGAQVEIDGTSEEIAQLLDFYSSSTQPARSGAFASSLTSPRSAGAPAGGLKLDGRVLGIFVAVMAVSLVVVIFLGYMNMRSVNYGLTTMYDHQVLPLGRLAQVQVALGQVRAEMLQFIFVPEGRAESEQALGQATDVVNRQLEEYRVWIVSMEERERLAEADQAWAACQDVVATLLAQAKSGDEMAARELVPQSAAAFNTLQESLALLSELKMKQGTVLSDQGDATVARATMMLVAIGVVEIVMVASLAVMVARRSS